MTKRFLSPEEAMRMFREDPENCFVNFSSFLRWTGMTPQEAWDEMQAGRLYYQTYEHEEAQLVPGDLEGLADIAVITAKDAMSWLNNAQSPLADRARAKVKGVLQ